MASRCKTFSTSPGSPPTSQLEMPCKRTKLEIKNCFDLRISQWNLEFGRTERRIFLLLLEKNQPRWHMINFYTAPIFTPSTSFRSISMYGKGGRLHGQWTADTFNADTLSSSNFVSCLHGTISDDTRIDGGFKFKCFLFSTLWK